MKKFITILSVFILSFNMLNFGVCAEEITPTPPSSAFDGTYTVSTYDLLEDCWLSAVKVISKSYIVGSDAIYGEFNHFLTWLEGDPNY